MIRDTDPRGTESVPFGPDLDPRGGAARQPSGRRRLAGLQTQWARVGPIGPDLDPRGVAARQRPGPDHLTTPFPGATVLATRPARSATWAAGSRPSCCLSLPSTRTRKRTAPRPTGRPRARLGRSESAGPGLPDSHRGVERPIGFRRNPARLSQGRRPHHCCSLRRSGRGCPIDGRRLGGEHDTCGPLNAEADPRRVEGEGQGHLGRPRPPSRQLAVLVLGSKIPRHPGDHFRYVGVIVAPQRRLNCGTSGER
jgi:hypothetical protein